MVAPQSGGAPARSLGDNIGSDKWLEAKKKKDDAKKYAKELTQFNQMKQQQKEAR